MPLNFTTIPIPFVSGIDSKSHPAHVPIGKLSELENGVFKNNGAIHKRNGYNVLPRTILDSLGKIEDAKGSAVYNSTDLLVFDGNNVYSYLPSLTKWADRGNCTSVNIRTKSIVNNTYEQTNPDMCINDGLELYAWDDSRGGVRYTVVDTDTKSQLATDILLSTTARHPKCLAVGSFLVIVCWHTGGQITASIIPKGAPENPNTYYLTSNALTSNDAFDAMYNDGYAYIAYNNNTGSTTFISFDENFTKIDSITTSEPEARAFSIFIGSDEVYIAWGDTSGNVKYAEADFAFSNLSTPQTVDTGILINNITGIESSFEDAPRLFYDNTSATIPIIKTCLLGFAAEEFIRSVSLAGKAFEHNDRIYFIAVFDSEIQPTYFVLNNEKDVVAKINESTAGGEKSKNCLASITIVDDEQYVFAVEKRGRVLSNNNLIFSLSGVASSNLDFDVRYRSALLNETIHLTGGILQAYDGNKVVEHGFNVFPEGIVSNPIQLGSIDAGLHSWMITYEWTDNTGKIERSAPSLPIQWSLGGENTYTGMILTIPTYHLTKKDGVRIVIYRTKSADTGDPLFYRITSISNPLLNDKTVSTVSYIDTASDLDISTNDVLYCSPDTSGIPIEVENIAAPNCTIATVYNNRVFIAGTNNPNQIWYSKTVVPGEPAAFNDSFTIDMNSIGGAITGLAVLDSNLIIFKENSIFALSGLGPTNSGAQNDFSDPQMIASDVGCINHDSIALVSSLGLFFQSSKGIYLLTRGLSTEYIGAPVERYNSQTIVAGVQVPNTTQVRFVCSDGVALMYDYYFQQWGVFTNHKAVSAGVWDGAFYFLTSLGFVHKEAENYYKDGTQAINMKITTGWLSFAGLQNYQKVRSFMFLGDYFGTHYLKISAAYDGNEYYREIKTLDTSLIFNNNVYGEQNVYGNNSPYGGTFDNEQFKIFIGQRCQRIKITIQEVQGFASSYVITDQFEPVIDDDGDLVITDPEVVEPNQGLSFVAINFEVGMKKGLGRIRAGKQTGLG